MNPQAYTLLFRAKHSSDHRAPTRREDEEPLNFMVSNATYRLVLLGQRLWEEWEARRFRAG